MPVSPTTSQPMMPRSESARPRPEKADMSSMAQQKASLNMAIMESNQVTLGVKDQPLALLFKTAIDSLNERLAPELGENAIQNAADSGMDFGPEATADRIVSLSTGFFEAFKAQNPGEDETALLNRFMDTIGSGIDKGFADAREILDGLGVLQGSIADNIDQTYERVQQGLQAFRDQFSPAGESA